MAFFVVVDLAGVHIYEYDTAEINIRPDEVLVGRFDSLQDAEAVEAQTDRL
jgi:hypothetical protein